MFIFLDKKEIFGAFYPNSAIAENVRPVEDSLELIFTK